jgi:hypothetical protein
MLDGVMKAIAITQLKIVYKGTTLFPQKKLVVKCYSSEVWSLELPEFYGEYRIAMHFSSISKDTIAMHFSSISKDTIAMYFSSISKDT